MGDDINRYPFNIEGAPNLIARGGSIWGTISQTLSWEETYINSAALRFQDAPGVVIDDWRIDKAWDAIRLDGNAQGFLIDDAYITNNRDDAVENDDNNGGTIRDSLFDGTFVGISLGDDHHVDGSQNTVSLEGVFMRMQEYIYKDELQHGTPFKADSGAPETTPDIRIINSVIAIQDPDHAGLNRLQIAWDHVTESRGNVFLNLSDTPLPSDYPKPPAGFTILQGQQARDYWEAAKAAWLDNHDGTPFAAITPLPALPGASAPTAPTVTDTDSSTETGTVSPTSTSSVNIINGTNRSDTLTGTSGVDHISGAQGGDKIFGKGGNDVLTGGSDWDKFVFDTALGTGNVDTITDFDTRYDYIYLDNAIFTKLGAGSLSSPDRISSSWFEAGSSPKADDSNDYIIYNKTTGVISYDADGNGSGAAIPFAQLAPGTVISYADFFVV
jgi:Ca2+-binding RTX toxin-like protein